MSTTRTILACMMLLTPLLCRSQSEGVAVGSTVAGTQAADTVSGIDVSPLTISRHHAYYGPSGIGFEPRMLNDSVTASFMTPFASTAYWRYPANWYGWGGYLHDGLNLCLDASVFAQFGKHARHGAGFGQQLSLLYALPVTDRLSVAIGGYLSNMYWAHDNYRDGGINALVNYRINDRWEAFVYGQKSFADNKLAPRPLYDIHALGDVVGGGVRYNFTPSFSMEVSVSYGKAPNVHENMHDTYHKLGGY